MPAAVEPVRGFALADFDGPDQPPDNPTIDQTTGKVIDPPPAPERTETPAAPEPGTADEPEKKDEPETPERPEGEATDEDDDSPTSLNEAMDEQAKSGTAEEKARIAAEKKKADEASEEKAKSEVEKSAEAKERDADLKVELGAHVRASTRKLITEFQSKAAAARDKEEAAQARAEAAEAKARELEEKTKTAEPPKELLDEVKTLRERVRELDISKDPVLEQKYDRRIETNNKSIVEVLKAQGYDTVRVDLGDGKFETKPNPNAIPELIKSGLTLKNLSPLIKKLEDGGLIEEAETIRESLRENGRMAREKQAEIDSWKGDYQKRQQVREQETKQQAEKRQAEFRQQTDFQLNADTEALAKRLGTPSRTRSARVSGTPGRSSRMSERMLSTSNQ